MSVPATQSVSRHTPAPGHGRQRGSVVVGLIGAGIQASRTPAMHEEEAAHLGLRYVYKLIDTDRLGLDVAALGDLVLAAERLGFAGLNITHPFKQVATRMVDVLSENGKAIGAINTIVFKDGRRYGYNTDCSGFAESFEREMSDVGRDNIVLLGAGGAGAAVAHALLGLGVGRVAIFDTQQDRLETLVGQLESRFGHGPAAAVTDLKAAMAEADGIINATPVGMVKYPGMPVPADCLRPDLWVGDIVYFPIDTELLQRARQVGCRVMSGAGMAIFQAVNAFRLFTGLEPDPERMKEYFLAAGENASV